MQQHGCEQCGCPEVLREWADAFGVRLCGGCRRHEQLISKTNAKSRYVLTDADLAKAKLGHLAKTNPQHKEWTPMRMYLLRQVEGVAIAKHGSLDAVAGERAARVASKIEDNARKRRAAELAQQVAAQTAAAAAAAAAQLAAAQAPGGAYADTQEELVDAGTGRKQRRLAPELAAAEVEEL